MSKKLKILVSIPSGFCFGLQHVSIDLFDACKSEIEPHFLLSRWSNGDFESLLEKKHFAYTYSWLGMFSRKLDIKNLKMSAEALLKIPVLYFDYINLIRREKPNVLFFANHHELILLLPLLWFIKIPIVCHMHDPAPSIRFQKYTFGCYEKVIKKFIAISDNVKVRLIELGCTVNKIAVVHNGINVKPLEPEFMIRKNEFSSAANWSDNVFIIGITGQMTETKGHEDVLQAFENAYKTNRQLRLVFGGKQLQPLYDKLKSEIEAKKLSSVVYFSGWLSDVDLFYRNVDVVILASRHDEGYGLVVAEAMAACRPVVITRSGGAVEIVEHNTSGIVVEKRDVAAMSDAILKYAENKSFYQSIVNNGRIRVEQHFSIDVAAVKFTNVLKSVSINN